MMMKQTVPSYKKSPERSFFSPLVGFACLAICIPITVLLYWPYPSSDPLWVTSYEIDKAIRTTLDTSSLPEYLLALSWGYHLLPIVVGTVFCILMLLVCVAFNERAHFTRKSIAYFSVIRWTLIIGLFMYWVMGIILDSQIAEFYQDYPHVSVNQEWANVPILSGFLLLMVVYFIEGALRRGLILQEDVDATI